MKQCPKCHKMNPNTRDNCKYCGYEIKWVPDDGTEYEPLPGCSEQGSASQDGEPDDGIKHDPPSDFFDREPDFQDSAGMEDEVIMKSEKVSLEDVYNQLEAIKSRMTAGVNMFDVTMPFHRMVVLIIKLMFASIPAMVIVGTISVILSVLFSGLFFGQVMRLFQSMMLGSGMH